MKRGRADQTRSIALGAATAAFIAVPNLGPLLFDTSEDTERYDTAITPPGYAFVVWAPIFASCLASTVQAVRPGAMTGVEQQATGWPLVGAYALNTLWSVAAQTDNFRYTPALLPAAVVLTAVAYRRLQSSPADRGSLASASTGLLLGWTSLAATVNLSAGTQLRGADPGSTASVTFSTLAAAAAAGGLCAVIAVSRRAYLPLATAAVWGFATTALDRKRTPVARLGTAISAAAIVATAAARTIRLRRVRVSDDSESRMSAPIA